MKPSEIKVGRCYANKSETTIHKVLGDGWYIKDCWKLLCMRLLGIPHNFVSECWSKVEFARWAHHKVADPQGSGEGEK
jgi:hypothetical protein